MSAPGQRLAARMADIAPFEAMEVQARARCLEARGIDVIHLEIGEPDFATPPGVVAAATRALAEQRMFYTSALGLPELRQSIAEFYEQRFGVVVAPERIVVTTGSSAALLLALGVLLDPGESLLLPDPSYPCNRHLARVFGAEVCAVPVGPEQGFTLDVASAQSAWTPQTGAVLVASPSNPTGTVTAIEQLRGLAELAAARGAALIVDEIYQGLLYEGEAKTALEISEDVFVVNSFSKYFQMTGWRLGWLVAPPRYVRELEKLAQNLFISPPTLSQYAALAAFEPSTLALLEERRLELDERRKYLVAALQELGLVVPTTPQGAFYVYADVSAFTRDSFAFCLELLEQAGVATTPGRDFGAHNAERYVRFAYTQPLPRLQEAVARLARHLKR